MLKAAAGGGGRGIRIITTEAELVDTYERARQEAARAFGSDIVFLESLVTGARHVEVQVIADGQGTAWALGVRDCSVQRRNQKIIEESASPVLSPVQAADLKAAAERLALAVGYRGAATVEFLYRPDDKLFAFLEVNTRLQVEHPITEATTGFDLVKAQLWVASGGKLEGEPPIEQGHAIEARLNAEDPDRDFAPSPGRIVHLELPTGPGIRVDTGFTEGDVIPSDFDSMIAKIIAHGRDREEALSRLRRAPPTPPSSSKAAPPTKLRPRPAQPAGGSQRHRRHRLDRPGPQRRPPGQPHAFRDRPDRRRDRSLRRRGTRRTAAAVDHRVRRPPPSPARQRPTTRPQTPRHHLPAASGPRRRPPVPRRH